MGKSTISRPSSIAMLNYQKVTKQWEYSLELRTETNKSAGYILIPCESFWCNIEVGMGHQSIKASLGRCTSTATPRKHWCEVSDHQPFDRNPEVSCGLCEGWRFFVLHICICICIYKYKYKLNLNVNININII